MTTELTTVEHYIDTTGNDCYRIYLLDGLCSTVSSAHLIEERQAFLVRHYAVPTPTPT
jgi:hypothetical protein